MADLKMSLLDQHFFLPLTSHFLLAYLTVAVSLAVARIISLHQAEKRRDTPIVSLYSDWVPDILSRLRFNSSAPELIIKGYKQVHGYSRKT